MSPSLPGLATKYRTMTTERIFQVPAWLLFLLIVGCGGETSRLIAELHHDDATVRTKAARALADPQFADNPSIVAALTAAIDDAEPSVQEAAIITLVPFGEAAKPALPKLEASLDSTHPAVRLSAARAIAHIDPASTHYQSALIEALRSGNAPLFLEVQQLANAQWAIPTLIDLLAHRQTHVRALSAQTIGVIGHNNAEVTSALKRRLQDAEPPVRRAAETALSQLQTQP
jgi:HEAT repeat protein